MCESFKQAGLSGFHCVAVENYVYLHTEGISHRGEGPSQNFTPLHILGTLPPVKIQSSPSSQEPPTQIPALSAFLTASSWAHSQLDALILTFV